MKIYFSASISKMSDSDRDNFRRIVDLLEAMGHKVIADHVIKRGKDGYIKQSESESLEAQRQLAKWKRMADLVVVEVSNPSFGVGQEIAQSIAASKPVIALHHESRNPHVLKDEGGDLLMLVSYNDDNLKKVIVNALDYASERQDTRFNFFISPKHQRYLDWIAKSRKLPRAVYLRRLIEEDMKKNKEYS